MAAASPTCFSSDTTSASSTCCFTPGLDFDALERAPQYAAWRPRFDLVEGDLRDPAAVDRAVAGRDTVIHLGAISNDPTGEVDELLTRQTNFDAIGMLLAKARAAGVQRFVNASSSSVFGIKDVPDVTEVLEPEPLTFYSKYKALSEWLVTAAAAPGFCAVDVRPATICGYSPRQRFDLTVNKLTADALRKRVITVHGGEQRRPNVGMTDMINLYGLLLRRHPRKSTDARSTSASRTSRSSRSPGSSRPSSPTSTSRSRSPKRSTAATTTSPPARSSKPSATSPSAPSARKSPNSAESLESGQFPDIDAAEHYNMKFMKVGRNAGAYGFLSR